jgi:hypothetical protein
VHSLKWTTEQKSRLAELADATPGLLVTPVLHLSGLEQARSYPVESVEAGFVKLAGGHLLNPAKDAKRFDVGTRRHLEVAQGDQLLIRMNDKAHGLVNGQVVTVKAVRPDGSVRTQCGKEIPATFRRFAHGYVVTSHKAQGRTERLFEGLPFDGNRRAALDVLKEQRQVARASIDRRPSIVNRIKIVATSAVRRVAHAGKRLRESAVVARRWTMPQAEVERTTKRKVKSLRPSGKQRLQAELLRGIGFAHLRTCGK